MRTLLTFALLTTSVIAVAGQKSPSVNGWFACHDGTVLKTTRCDAESVVTQPFPKSNVVSFLLHEPCFLGDTVTSTFRVDASVPCYWTTSYTGGCSTPPNIRFFFSTRSGKYVLSDANANCSQYWWSNPISFLLPDIDDGLPRTLTVSLDPSQWSDALGHGGNEHLAEFLAAVANAKQAGFAFGGGCFFDVGAGTLRGSTATLQVLSFDTQ